MINTYTFECYLTDKDGNLMTDSYKDTSGYSNESDCQYEAISQARELFDFYKYKRNVDGAVIYIQKNGKEYKELRLTPAGGSLAVKQDDHLGDSVRVNDSEEFKVIAGVDINSKEYDDYYNSDEYDQQEFNDEKFEAEEEELERRGLSFDNDNYVIRFKDGHIEINTISDAIEGLAIKEGINLVEFSDAKIGYVSYYGSHVDWFKILRKPTEKDLDAWYDDEKIEDSVRIDDSIDINEFISNFDPYVLEETVESDDDYEDRTYSYYDYDSYNEHEGDEIQKNIYLRIGDKNSDVVLSVIVSDITVTGQYEFDIDDVENADLNISVLIKNGTVWSKIDELIYSEVVFDETH